MSVLVIALFGALALQRLKRDILPNIDIPVVIVIWNYPGCRPTTWSSASSSSPSARCRRRSTASSASSRSRCRASASSASTSSKGTDIGSAIAQITAVCGTILRILPPGITPPNILQFNASNVQVAQLTLKSDSLTEQDLYDYGLNFLRLKLFTIPGLATPAPFGGRSRQIMVDLDPQKMQAQAASRPPTSSTRSATTTSSCRPATRASATSTTTCS